MPQHLLNNILQDLQLNQSEIPNDDTILVFKNLVDIIEIFQHCPATLQHDHNRSTNFINSLERQPLMKMPEQYGRIDMLLQHVNNRIYEKFKGFTEAFRRFDKNFDGSLEFREFVLGMGEMGMNLTLPDYRLIFDKIDYNKEEEIDYFKFCLLDYDKEALRQRLTLQHQTQNKSEKSTKSKDESGVNPRYRDGNMPKNKDPKRFIEECQTQNLTRTFLKQKLSIKSTHEEIKCAKDLPNDHVFGVLRTEAHDMKGIMQNAYDVKNQQNFEQIEADYKPALKKYNLKPPKPTKANIMRAQA